MNAMTGPLTSLPRSSNTNLILGCPYPASHQGTQAVRERLVLQPRWLRDGADRRRPRCA